MRIVVAVLMQFVLIVAVHAQSEGADSTWRQPVSAPDWLDTSKPRMTDDIFAPEVIGGTPSDDQRIVGIVVQFEGGGAGLCSGLWISAGIILTAAHCLCRDGTVTKLPPLLTNETDFKDTDKSPWVEASGFVLYPGWSCARSSIHARDLALIYMGYIPPPIPNDVIVPAASTRRVPLENEVQLLPACAGYTLYPNIRPFGRLASEANEKMRVGGFGYDETGKTGFRNEAVLGVSALSCRSRTAQLLGCRAFAEFILGAGKSDIGRRDACGGDSGGPAFLRSDDGAFIPVGVVSRGVRARGAFQGGACGSGGIYTHLGVPDVRRWLLKYGVLQRSGRCDP